MSRICGENIENVALLKKNKSNTQKNFTIFFITIKLTTFY